MVLNGTDAASRRDPATYGIPGFFLGPDARPVARGLAAGESEISLSANIDQVLYGNLTVALSREGAVGDHRSEDGPMGWEPTRHATSAYATACGRNTDTTSRANTPSDAWLEHSPRGSRW